MDELPAFFLSLSSLFSAGEVLEPPLWGPGVSEGAGHRKNFVGHMYKYAIFDIKPTYNH